MCCTQEAQLLGNGVRAAQGVLHLRLLLQEVGVCFALVLLQLSVQGRLRHIGCNLQAVKRHSGELGAEWLAGSDTSPSSSTCKSAQDALLTCDVDISRL